jgi:hypothetical protein
MARLEAEVKQITHAIRMAAYLVLRYEVKPHPSRA